MNRTSARRLWAAGSPTELQRVISLILAGRAGFEPAHSVINNHVPSQLGYRPKNIHKKQKAPVFAGAFESLNLNLVVLWTDQSRRPSAINAPSHHGFNLGRHYEIEYSTDSTEYPKDISW